MFFRKNVALILILAMVFSIAVPKTAKAEVLNAQRIDFIERHAETAIRLGAEYGMPWETATGIAIYESQSGTSYSAVKRHNFHGLSAGKNSQQKFASDEEGWKAFYENILEQPCYTKRNALQYRDDPCAFLNAIVRAGYNPNPDKYLTKVEPFVKAVMEYRDERGLPSSAYYLAMGPIIQPVPEITDSNLNLTVYTVVDPATTICISENAVTTF